MQRDEKPAASGPSPARKANAALGAKLKRPAKEPPTFPGKKLPQNPPPSKRSTGQ